MGNGKVGFNKNAIALSGSTTANTAPTFAIAPGIVTTSLGSGDDQAYAITLQSDGKILQAGMSYVAGNKDVALVRYNSDGSLDTSFSSDGKLTSALGTGADAAYGVVLSGSTIWVVGETTSGSYTDFALLSYNSSGTLDSSVSAAKDTSYQMNAAWKSIDAYYYNGYFGYSAYPSKDTAYSVALQSDGKIIAAGYYTFQQGNTDFAVARFDSSGNWDSGFGSSGVASAGINFYGGYGQAKAVAVQSDGKIVAAGNATWSASSKNDDIAVVRFTSTGALDTTFSGDGIATLDLAGLDDFANSVKIQSDGKILVYGNFIASTNSDGTGNYDFFVARYTSTGSLDTSFSGDGIATVSFGNSNDINLNGLMVQSDGKLILSGYTYNGYNYDFAVARLNANGTLDTSFSGDGKLTTAIGGRNDYATGIALQSDGKLLLGGYSYDNDSQTNDFALVRYTTSGVLDKTFGVSSTTLDGAPVFTEDGAAIVLDADVEIYDAELAAADSYSGATLKLIRKGGANTEDRYAASGILGSLDEGGALMVSTTSIGTVTQNSGGTLILSFNTKATQALVDTVLQSIAYSNTSNAPPTSVTIDWTFSDGSSTASGSTVVSLIATDDGMTASYGTENSNDLYGTVDADRLYALAGDDKLYGLGGSDFLDGGEGDDNLKAGPGNDTLFGGTGGDVLDGGQGNDSLMGGDDADTLGHYAGSGNDTLSGGNGADTFTLFCGNSADNISVSGGDQNDVIAVDMVATTASDVIKAAGGSGSDIYSYSTLSLQGTAGYNQLSGLNLPVMTVTDFAAGAGGDSILTTPLLEISASGGRGYAGGNPFASALGYLRLKDSGGSTLVQWDMDGAAGSSHTFETFMILQGVKATSLTADNFHDGIKPDGSTSSGESLKDTANVAELMVGEYGNDTIQGAWGNDTLNGLGGNDSLDGGEDDDKLYGGMGNDTLDGGDGGVYGDGYDTLDGGLGNDSIEGGDGKDELTHAAGEGSDSMWGGTGDDKFEIDIAGISGLSEDVVAYGGDGVDTFSLTLAADTTSGTIQITGGAGTDIYNFNDGNAARGGLTVTDFAAGKSGDMILTEFLLNASGTGKGGYVDGNPFKASLGYLQLTQSGSSTLLQWDRDGASGSTYSFQTIMVMQSVTKSSLVAANFAEGFSPDGTESNGTTPSATSGNDTLLGSYAADTISGGGGNDSAYGMGGSDLMDGGEGNDNLAGNGGNDTLTGGAGNDTLDGGVGADRLDGGDGNDELEHLSGEGNDTLIGGAGNDEFAITHGNFSSDGETVTIQGDAGDDTLRIDLGGSWTIATTLRASGGAGQDVYAYANYDDTSKAPTLVISDFVAGAGGDLIDLNGFLEISALGTNGYSSGSPFKTEQGYTRLIQNGANAELQYDQDGAGGTKYSFTSVISFTGIDKAAITTDNFVGKIIVGTEDPDILSGDWTNDSISGLGGEDTLDGGEGDDHLEGGSGADILSGDSGADDMAGGKGADTYYVDDSGDVVYETDNLPDDGSSSTQSVDLGDAIDTVMASISYTLTNYVENLNLSGTQNLSGTGNSLQNTLTGNSGNNTLAGEGGNDSIDGGKGTDTVKYTGNLADYTVTASATGYLVTDNTAGRDGTDTLTSIEKLQFADQTISLDGSADPSESSSAIEGDTGNNKLPGTADDDVIYGLAGNDQLSGSSGDDWLVGGEGVDKLTGGSGADSFVFDYAANGNADKIADFKISEGDLLVFDTSVFTSLAGGIAAGNVVIGATVKALDDDDYLLFSTKGGKLYYDADGSGTTYSAVQLAGIKGSFTGIDYTSFSTSA